MWAELLLEELLANPDLETQGMRWPAGDLIWSQDVAGRKGFECTHGTLFLLHVIGTCSRIFRGQRAVGESCPTFSRQNDHVHICLRHLIGLSVLTEFFSDCFLCLMHILMAPTRKERGVGFATTFCQAVWQTQDMAGSLASLWPQLTHSLWRVPWPTSSRITQLARLATILDWGGGSADFQSEKSDFSGHWVIPLYYQILIQFVWKSTD